MEQSTNKSMVFFDPQFFGPIFRLAFLAFMFVELLSFLTYSLRYYFDAGWIIMIVVALGVLIIGVKRLEYALMMAFAELFIGSKGQLFFWQGEGIKVSWRMAIFAAVMLAFIINLCRSGQFKKMLNKLGSYKELIYLAAFCLVGLLWATVSRLPFTQIFFDFNGWLYFLYVLPCLLVFDKFDRLNKILQILMAAAVAISLKSFVYLYVFSHRLAIMKELYRWGRDTGFGEFTLLSGDLYRIFSQAHIFVFIVFIIVLSYLIFKGRLNYRQPLNQYLFLVLFACLSTLMLSLSRSFWVGLIAAASIGLILSLVSYKLPLKELLIAALRISFLLLLSYAMIVAIVEFPIPGKTGGYNENLLSGRLSLNDGAVSSRWSQLPELGKAIAKHPVIGSGWGSTVTYKSQDPRILTSTNPEGWYTTSAFEWGYLDMVLKIGLAGLLAYLYVLWKISRNIELLWKKNKDRYFRALLVGLFLSLIGIAAVHGFSPYLNHPLGIGFLIIIIVFLDIFKNHSTLQELNR